MYNENDKGLYKAIYVDFMMRNLKNDEHLKLIASLMTFINKECLFDEYNRWSKKLKKELKDEEIRLAMMEEQEE